MLQIIRSFPDCPDDHVFYGVQLTQALYSILPRVGVSSISNSVVSELCYMAYHELPVKTRQCDRSDWFESRIFDMAKEGVYIVKDGRLSDSDTETETLENFDFL